MRAAVLGLLLAGCALAPEAPPEPSYTPNRSDYLAFREGRAALLEPNYLPFMLHGVAGGEASPPAVILCRWDADQMPLAVEVVVPDIPAALQHDVHPRGTEEFVAAARSALRVWERELEGLVTFRMVEPGELADLRIRLLAERAPIARRDRVVLGSTEALLSACRVEAMGRPGQAASVRFTLPEFVVYLADEFGLLNPGQVERVVLHELGHALGMLGHSPVPSDMMYAAYRERSDVEALSQADVNSFVSLYRLPNGTRYAEVPAESEELPGRVRPDPPPGELPLLSRAPVVDARRGFALRFPEAWLVAEGRRGVFASNGPVWDFDVSLELAVWPYPDVASFLARYGDSLFAGSWFRQRGATTLAGQEGLRVLVEDEAGETARDFRFIPLGDGSLLVALAQLPAAHQRVWLTWVEASLATLELSTDTGWE